MSDKKISKVETAASWRELLNAMSTKKHANGIDYKSAIIRQLLKAAAGGKEWAIRYILDQQLGKAVNLVQSDLTSGGKPLSASVSFVGAESTAKAIEPIVDQSISELPESPSD
jgi:hypothetical protein